VGAGVGDDGVRIAFGFLLYFVCFFGGFVWGYVSASAFLLFGYALGAFDS
jgi:hypothetical protein